MVIDDVRRFEEISSVVGNRYQAVNLISKMARKLGRANSDYQISEPQLIQWVLTGECPYTKSQLELRRLVAKNCDLDDILAWVDDLEVCRAVETTYSESLKQRKLLEFIDNGLGTFRTQRVNILLRIAWYSC